MLNFQEVDDPLFDVLAKAHLLGPRLAVIDPSGQESGCQMHMGPEFDVVQNGHVSEEFHVLECSRDSQARDFMRLLFGNVSPLEQYGALFRMIKSIDAIKEAGFARPVGTDNGEYLSFVDTGADPVKGRQATKAEVEVPQFELIGAFVSHA
jgi:hypothetical protein